MSKKHKSKLLALLEFHVDGEPFNTQEATDFLNAYKSKNGIGLHRYTQTTHRQLGAILSASKKYIMINPNKGKNKCAIWKYVGEEE
jgi:hypothetical protein